MRNDKINKQNDRIEHNLLDDVFSLLSKDCFSDFDDEIDEAICAIWELIEMLSDKKIL